MFTPLQLPETNINYLDLPINHAPTLKRILCYNCGPCNATGCPIGSRLVGICSHVATVLKIGCQIAFNPNIFNSTHRPINILSRSQSDNLNVLLASEVCG